LRNQTIFSARHSPHYFLETHCLGGEWTGGAADDNDERRWRRRISHFVSVSREDS